MLVNRRTVFVLGAGASKALGFPLASELKEQVERNLASPRKVAELAEALHPGSSPSLFESPAKRLSESLQRSNLPSIDAFLETHRKADSYLDLAKAAIAQALLPFEDESALLSEPDWYADLFGRLLAESGYEDFARHEISFITFNYDRSLEHYLVETLASASGADRAEVWEKLSAIPIIHLYGSLGPLPVQQAGGGIRYGIGTPTPRVILQAAQNLQLIGDQTPASHLAGAQELVQSADFVFFLGFGYHRLNLSRLKPDRLFSTIFRGSAFREPAGRQQDIRNAFSEIFDGHPVNFFHGRAQASAQEVQGVDCRSFVGRLSLSSLVRQ